MAMDDVIHHLCQLDRKLVSSSAEKCAEFYSKNSVPILHSLTPSLFSIGTTIFKNSL